MWSRLARVAAAAALATLPALVPPTSTPASAFSQHADISPTILGPAAQGGDACPEPNDTFQAACYLGPESDARGFLSRPGDVDAYRIEVLDFNTEVHVELPTKPGDFKAALADWNGDVIATTTPNGSGGEALDHTVHIPGVYYIFVHSPSNASSAQPYQIFRALTYPGASIPEIIGATEFREGSEDSMVGDFEHARHKQEGGRYIIEAKSPGTPDSPSQAWWTGFGEELTDFTMTLDARIVNKVDAGFSVFFRHQDDANTYMLGVDAKDGQVLLLKRVNGEAVGNTGWIPTEAVDVDGGVNRVVIHCFEDEIRVNVNGEEVFSMSDGTYRKGYIGVGTIAFGPPPVISFDNFIITTPSEGLDAE